MKGLILAGGFGTRLGLATKVTNKHLLPVYDKPMICYPLQTLKDANIKDIVVITGPEHTGQFMSFLNDGKEFDVNLTYRVQKEPKGIAHAISLAKDFVGNDNLVAILGDNIFEDNIKEYTTNFKEGGKIFLKEVDDANRFGVAELEGNKVINIQEKPQNPKTNYIVTGLYMYDNTVFDIISNLKPSARNELEITDVNNAYIQKNSLEAIILKGFWSDAGTPNSLYKATKFLYEKQNKQ